MAHARLDRETRQLDADHEAPLSHLADPLQRLDVPLQPAAQQLDLDLEAVDRPLLLEHVERGQRGGAGQGVGGVGVAVEERPELGVLAQESLVDALGGERRGQRQVAAAQALGQA